MLIVSSRQVGKTTMLKEITKILIIQHWTI